jgi:hypothetical protein
LQQDIEQLRQWLGGRIVGQEHLIERLMIALLADGHLLVEGAPGLAKTKAIKTLSEGLEADFHRVQFTPDLLLVVTFTAPKKVPLNSKLGRCSITWCLLMKSIAHRPKYNQHS